MKYPHLYSHTRGDTFISLTFHKGVSTLTYTLLYKRSAILQWFQRFIGFSNTLATTSTRHVAIPLPYPKTPHAFNIKANYCPLSLFRWHHLTNALRAGGVSTFPDKKH
jgi:hypothetical protein